MLRNIKDMHGFSLKAKDGEIGKADEFYFDDHTWVIRYLVADTGSWLVDNKVLISPDSIESLNWEREVFQINLTKDQIEQSPKIANDKPVSHQHEINMVNYYGWPNYWAGMSGPVVGAIHPLPVEVMNKAEREAIEVDKQEEPAGDPNLRSTNEVTGYNIQASDGSIGHVEDFLVDDEWKIRYLIVDTRNWLPGGRKVILSLNWIKDINWTDSSVKVNLTKDQIKNSPDYDPSAPPKREYEDTLFKHYQKEKYWDE